MALRVRKIPILRYFLIILLFSVLFVSAFYLYLHYKKAQTLRSNVEKLISARENTALIDSCIINLYSADNYSRLYTITGDKSYLQKFLGDINKISGIIDKIRFDKKDVPESDPAKFKVLMKEKTETTGSYMKLRLLTDSLIRSSSRMRLSLSKLNQKTNRQTVKVEHIITLDTVKQEKPKKKLFGRIFSAFSAKKNPVIIKRDTLTTVTTIPVRGADKNAYDNYYKKLNVVNNQLMTNERQMLIINNNLIEEIIASLKLYKSVETLYIKDSKVELKENLANIYDEFRHVSTLNFIFLLSLIILMFYNIWKIFRNEQEIIYYSEKAEQHAESKSRFLAGMSHEIRTPLNSVIGFSEQLSQEELPPVQKEQVDAIRSSSEMLLDLVNEILDFSKYETGKMNFESAPFMLCHAIEDVFTSMHIHAMKKNIILENKITIDDAICCTGDKVRLKQVILNLLGNALKFTIKGKVTLVANIEKGIGKDLLLKVQVIDTGLGIAKNDLPYIFEEFSQVANAQKVTRHKGTGLGLAICKKIIELQGGFIGVNSTSGQGSSFNFTLPLKQCNVAEISQSQDLSDEMMAELVKDKYILFAEDNKLNVLLGSTLLKKWKIKYDVAYDGRQATKLFEQNKYDLILTDIQMPELNGIEVTQYVRNSPDIEKSKIPIIALTANVMKEDRDIYFSAGMNDVILKPFLEKNLIEKTALALQNTDTAMRFMA